MDIKDKEWIDNASYEMLLDHWRNAPIGDRFFYGELSEYYAKVMLEKKEALSDNGAGASKRIGWD